MKKKELIIFITVFIFSLIIFYNFVNMHYATDTYNIINRGYKEYAIKYSLNDGRIFMCLIGLIADFIKLPIQTFIITLTVLAIFVSCICVMLIRKNILKYKEVKNIGMEILVTLISYVTIFNFMYLENMQFAECFVMSLSILFYIIASNILIEKNNNYILKSMLLTTCGILCYQGTIGFLVLITFVFSLINYPKNFKQTATNTILSGILCIIGVVVNLIQIKVCGEIFNMTQNRMGGFENIIFNLKYIVKNLKYILINNSDLFPSFLMILYIISIFCIISIYCIEKSSFYFVYVVEIIIVAICVAFAPNLFSLAGFGSR